MVRTAVTWVARGAGQHNGWQRGRAVAAEGRGLSDPTCCSPGRALEGAGTRLKGAATTLGPHRGHGLFTKGVRSGVYVREQWCGGVVWVWPS